VTAARIAGWLLPAFVLAGCATVASEADPTRRYENIGSFAESAATRRDWMPYLIRMHLGLFPDARQLPAGHVLPRAEVEAGLSAAATSTVAFTWIGHATALIRIGERWILTDPVFMGTVGAGPLRLARLAPPAPTLAGLPPIDLILISHADYDHVDLPSLRRLAVRNPETIVLAPEGARALLAAAGFRAVIEMPWYAKGDWDGIAVEAVPAIHGVRRPPGPADSSHWGGWILTYRGTRLYFAGDTGFGSVFGDIRRRSGPVDFALVPIGAYRPRTLEAPFHVDPEEAAEIARILGARVALGIHWGTFALSEEPPTEQRERFLAASGRGLATRVPRVGETIVLVP